MRKHWPDKLVEIGACAEAVAWARTQKSLAIAWEHCERADWMLWLLGHTLEPTVSEHRRLTLVACGCARKVLHLIPAGEDRPRLAIEAAEKWAREPTKEHRAAAEEARAAAGAAARAAWAAARAAGAAARAARAAEAAALKDYCEIIRRHFPKPPNLKAAE